MTFNSIPGPRPVTYRQVVARLAQLRARRRRLGYFDFSSDSYDMRSTEARAYRIWGRILGERRPLQCMHWGTPVRWNTYHH